MHLNPNTRFAKYESNQNVNNSSLEGANINYHLMDNSAQSNTLSISNNLVSLQNRLKLPESKNETNLSSALASNSSSNSIFDLVSDAELLETSVKKNDKYTVRRILDMHFSYFRTKQYDMYKKATFNIPSIFYNILHLSIENNSLDVLRICLKYGLDSNECGISKTIESKFSFRCNFCTIKKLAPTDSKLKVSLINYCSYNYLITLPPLFLSISKCNHQATQLLLSYGACPNIQDNYDNSPLHVAAAKPNPCFECIYLLLKYHADCYLSNVNGATPAQLLNQVMAEKKLEPSAQWDYSMGSIYSRIIGEIFKGLEMVCQSSRSKANSDMNQSARNDRLFFISTNKSTRNLNKSSTLQQNPKESCSLKNISKLTSSNSYLNETECKSDIKQLVTSGRKKMPNQNSGSDANLNSVKRSKNKLKKEMSEAKNLITVFEPGEKCKSLINVTPNNFVNQNIDGNEGYLLKKYARYSRSPVNKVGSAVVRIPTFNQSIKIDKIDRQTSLSNFMINKLNSILMHMDLIGEWKTSASKSANQLTSNLVLQMTTIRWFLLKCLSLKNHKTYRIKINIFSSNFVAKMVHIIELSRTSRMQKKQNDVLFWVTSQSQHLKSNKTFLNGVNESISMDSLQQQSISKKDNQNVTMNSEFIKEKYESTFKSIFTELEKFSSNIECVKFIIDELQLHIKEFLETICFRDDINEFQLADSSSNLNNQPNSKLPLQNQIDPFLEDNFLKIKQLNLNHLRRGVDKPFIQGFFIQWDFTLSNPSN
ncbi:serine threonine kinase, partial [Brachionus plicatilis]